mmetsp:Transcript_24718/g.50832  ORF Transcript_24718/g.50832 Transcript_24718/m.50832 type:complete len:240 (+) Transcript_24718:88-807(+)
MKRSPGGSQRSHRSPGGARAHVAGRSGAQTQAFASSRIPSVSRAVSAICNRRPESPCMVEFVGGPMRWRFVEEDFLEPESPARRQVPKMQSHQSRSQPNLHDVTIAAGWGEKSERERRLAKLVSKLGYCPGLPRRGFESRLSSFLPAEFRAGSFSNYRPKPPPQKSNYSGDVNLETRQNLRILELPPDGDRLVLRRWGPGFFELPPKPRSPDSAPRGAEEPKPFPSHGNPSPDVESSLP